LLADDQRFIHSEGARPYLFELKDNFTYMQLKAVLSCSSKFAKRLYALACQWRTAGTKEMTISDLKEMLYLKDPKGKEKEQFERISEFQSKVLDVAKRQINEQTDIKFDYKLRKRGRSYHYIKLFVNYTDNPQLQIDFKDPPEFLKKIRAITACGVHEDAARTIASNQKHFNDFTVLHDQMIAGMQKGTKIIDDPAIYIVDHFQRKGVLEISLMQKAGCSKKRRRK